jgi:hypothetical protein
MRRDINDLHYWQCTTLNSTLKHIILSFLKQNNFPMREWHVKHMEQTIVRFVRGLSENATRWEVKLNKKYGKISNVIKRIDYDVKHGVTNEQVLSFLQLMTTDSNYLEAMDSIGSLQRLNELQAYYKDSSPQLSFNWTNAVTG